MPGLSAPPTRHQDQRWLFALALLIVGLAISAFGYASFSPASVSALLPKTTATPHSVDTSAIRLHLQQIIQSKLRNRQADHVSIYFRDLSSDSSFGIGEDYQFSPASLMKVPVMIAHLKRAANDPAYLTKKILFNSSIDHTGRQGFKPLLSIRKGESYSIDELLHYMISYSDNNALELLLQHLDNGSLSKVLNDLHVDYLPSNDGGQVSLKNYANLFQSLYDGSYLGAELSAHALHYLSQEEFKEGIFSGVPQGTVVAAKFGEWALGANSELRTLQEVGIVYFSGHPYLLGVETEGPQIDELSLVIREISREVYAQVNAENSRRKAS